MRNYVNKITHEDMPNSSENLEGVEVKCIQICITSIILIGKRFLFPGVVKRPGSSHNLSMMEVNVWDVNDEYFELPEEYQVLNYLGAGAYGTVCSALDLKTQEKVMRNLHQAAEQRSCFHRILHLTRTKGT